MIFKLYDLATMDAIQTLGRFNSYYDAVAYANRVFPLTWSQDYRIGQ